MLPCGTPDRTGSIDVIYFHMLKMAKKVTLKPPPDIASDTNFIEF